jgi:hypothetical protein
VDASAAPAAPAPGCPKCGAENAPRSLRHGVRETVLLRWLNRAPYRCRDCGERFIAHASGHPHRHKTLAGYFGIRDRKEQHRFHERVIGCTGTLIALVFGLLLTGYCTRPTRPPEPQGGPGPSLAPPEDPANG